MDQEKKYSRSKCFHLHFCCSFWPGVTNKRWNVCLLLISNWITSVTSPTFTLLVESLIGAVYTRKSVWKIKRTMLWCGKLSSNVNLSVRKKILKNKSNHFTCQNKIACKLVNLAANPRRQHAIQNENTYKTSLKTIYKRLNQYIYTAFCLTQNRKFLHMYTA